MRRCGGDAVEMQMRSSGDTVEMQRRCSGDAAEMRWRCGEDSYYASTLAGTTLLPYYSPHSIPTYWRVLRTGLASTTCYGEYLGGRFLRRFLEEEAKV